MTTSHLKKSQYNFSVQDKIIIFYLNRMFKCYAMDRLDVVHAKPIIANDSKPLFYQTLALKV